MAALFLNLLFRKENEYCLKIFISRFAGTLSRDQAAAILNGQQDGAFIIRESPTSPGLAISIKYGNDIKHIKFQRSANRYYLTEAKQFSSVEEVINYYKNNSLGVSFPSLPTKLTKGVSSKLVLLLDFSII